MHYGLDIGGTKIELAVFDGEFNQLSSTRLPTPHNDYQQFLNTIETLVKEADANLGFPGTVGIGFPGFVDRAGLMVSSNVPCLNKQAFATDIGPRLGRPVALQNDMNLFALSEATGGAGEGYRYVLGLILGTGLGGGLCINHQLYLGRTRSGRECGHIPLPAVLQQRYDLPLRECGCGLSGCNEVYLSGPGLLWMSSHFGGSYDSVSAVVDALRAGEAAARTTFAAYMDCLGCYVAKLTLMYDPHVIVVGGGLSNIAEIYQQLPAAAQPYLFDGVELPEISPPAFGDSSGVRGAALLALQGQGGSVDESPGKRN